MIVYRVVPKNSSDHEPMTDGVNTFDYEQGEQYLHFFILPENVEVFQLLAYKNRNIDSEILQCDIPFKLIKNNFGAGMYRWYDPKIRTAFPEVRIKAADFSEKFVVQKSDEVKKQWKDEKIYSKFMSDCTERKNSPVSILSFEPLKVKLRKDFNFLDYFKKDDLIKEGIISSEISAGDPEPERF